MRASSSLIARSIGIAVLLAAPGGCARVNQTLGFEEAPVTQAPLARGGFAQTDNLPLAVTANQLTDNTVTGPVNGIYRGLVSLVSNNEEVCPRSMRGLVEIGDRTLLFPYTPEHIFVARVPTDGHLHAEDGAWKLDGELAGGDLTVVVSGPDCKSELAFTRVRFF